MIFRYGNFFILRVEKSSKMSPWEKNSCLPRAYGPWEDKIFCPWANFWGFFNPGDEEISIPEKRPIRKSYIPVWVYTCDGHWEISIPFHLVDSYRNIISEWAVGFRYGNFTLKLARGKKKPCLPRAYGPWEASFSSRGLIFGGEEISIPETRPIQKSYIGTVQRKCKSVLHFNDFKWIDSNIKIVATSEIFV